MIENKAPYLVSYALFAPHGQLLDGYASATAYDYDNCPLTVEKLHVLIEDG